MANHNERPPRHDEPGNENRYKPPFHSLLVRLRGSALPDRDAGAPRRPQRTGTGRPPAPPEGMNLPQRA